MVNFIVYFRKFWNNFFASCNSSESTTQSITGPSNISGTVFEVPLEFDAGENPLSIAEGDLNGDNKKTLLWQAPESKLD